MFRSLKDRNGFALVTAVWMLLLLSTLTLAYATFIRATAQGSHLREHRFRAEQAGLAAAELVAYSLNDTAAASNGSFAFRLGQIDINAQLSDEAGRVDLNGAPAPLLTALFAFLGLPQSEAKDIAEGVVAWRDGRVSLAEALPDQMSPTPRRPRPFEDAAELALVPGMPAELVARARRYVTVYTGSTTIDRDAADEELATSLSNQTGAMVVSRQAGSVSPGNGPVRLIVRSRFPDGFQLASQFVLRMTKGEPYRFLYVDNPCDACTDRMAAR
jgi:general secretion pathway protein K